MWHFLQTEGKNLHSKTVTTRFIVVSGTQPAWMLLARGIGGVVGSPVTTPERSFSNVFPPRGALQPRALGSASPRFSARLGGRFKHPDHQPKILKCETRGTEQIAERTLADSVRTETGRQRVAVCSLRRDLSGR